MMKRVRTTFFIAIALLFGASLHAQQPIDMSTQPPRPQPKPIISADRIVFGGSLGLRFGNFTQIDVSPLVGYKLSDHFVPGVGFRYLYYSENFAGSNYRFNIVGGCAFARLYVIEQIFAHAEYEVLNAEWDPFAHPNERFNVASVLVGGGYRQVFDERFSSYLMVLFDTSQERYSPYQGPIFRAGIGIGL